MTTTFTQLIQEAHDDTREEFYDGYFTQQSGDMPGAILTHYLVKAYLASEEEEEKYEEYEYY